MRGTVLILVLSTLFISCGSSDYYTFNNGEVYSQEQVQLKLEQASEVLPLGQYLKPTIYHKQSKGDKVLNFVSFSV